MVSGTRNYQAIHIKKNSREIKSQVAPPGIQIDVRCELLQFEKRPSI